MKFVEGAKLCYKKTIKSAPSFDLMDYRSNKWQFICKGPKDIVSTLSQTPPPSQLKCHSSFPPSSPHLLLSVHSSCPCTISCRIAECTLYTHFAQRFAYLQVNCCECSRRRGNSREAEKQKSSVEKKVEERDCFSNMMVPLNLNYQYARSLHAS